jgi:Family of unknown function (DUF6515)
MNNAAQSSGNLCRRPALICLVTALVPLCVVPLARAEQDHDDRGRIEQHERHDAKPYKPYGSEHWVLDSRFHHNHYYPALGYSVSTLPPGYLDIGVGKGHLFFSAGVWFRPQGRAYVVVAPPYGAYLPILPPDYTTFWIGNTPYYYANSVYYTQAPTGGYAVAAPPPEDQAVMQPPPPPPPVAASAPFPPTVGDGLIIYPKGGQGAAQMAADRADCTRWAVGQTGFDPARSAPGDMRRTDFQRAAGACLEAHGYTVR